VISSYTRRSARWSTPALRSGIVGIGRARSRSAGAGLPWAAEEATVVGESFPHATVLSDAAATREATLTALPNATIAHFSCHGVLDVGAPSDLRDRLHDGTMTVLDVSRFAPCAALSWPTCPPAPPQSVAPSWRTSNPPHLGAATRRVPAGDRHAVARSRPGCRAGGRDVYTRLARRNGTVGPPQGAAALHQAVHDLRDSYPDRPFCGPPTYTSGLRSADEADNRRDDDTDVRTVTMDSDQTPVPSRRWVLDTSGQPYKLVTEDGVYSSGRGRFRHRARRPGRERATRPHGDPGRSRRGARRRGQVAGFVLAKHWSTGYWPHGPSRRRRYRLRSAALRPAQTDQWSGPYPVPDLRYCQRLRLLPTWKPEDVPEWPPLDADVD